MRAAWERKALACGLLPDDVDRRMWMRRGVLHARRPVLAGRSVVLGGYYNNAAAKARAISLNGAQRDISSAATAAVAGAEVGRGAGAVNCRKRLGGLSRYYHRPAA
jgi:hypothetical protein